jgi:hypothetical protein
MRSLVLVSICLAWPALLRGQTVSPLGLAPAARRISATSHAVLEAGAHRFSLGAQAPVVGLRSVAAESGTPRWLKWGLVGAVGGGGLFAIAGQSDSGHAHSVAGDAAYGAATGFVLVGGGVWLYDWVCSRGSRSRADGLCGH